MTMTTGSTANGSFENRLRVELLALHEKRFGTTPARERQSLGDPRYRPFGIPAASDESDCRLN
jgi:hypothetical protein